MTRILSFLGHLVLPEVTMETGKVFHLLSSTALVLNLAACSGVQRRWATPWISFVDSGYKMGPSECCEGLVTSNSASPQIEQQHHRTSRILSYSSHFPLSPHTLPPPLSKIQRFFFCDIYAPFCVAGARVIIGRLLERRTRRRIHIDRLRCSI
jgi:hypothetical protein